MAVNRRALLVGGTALVAGGAGLAIGSRFLGSPVAATLVPDDPSLVGMWTFDETQGDVVHDASPNRNDGILVAPVEPGWGSGAFTGSVAVGGDDKSFVSIPASASLNTLKTALTVTAVAYPRKLWVPGDPYDGHIVLVQRQWRRVLHPDLFYLGYGPRADGLAYKWHVGLVGAEPSFYERTADHTPTVGRWVHLAGVYDGASGEMSLYVDGDLIAIDIHEGEIRLDKQSLQRPLMIGAELNTASRSEISGPFDGNIDEVRIYGRALSAIEIADLAQAAKAKHPAA